MLMFPGIYAKTRGCYVVVYKLCSLVFLSSIHATPKPSLYSSTSESRHIVAARD